jgi:[protein-PII] uridylyltransferase
MSTAVLISELRDLYLEESTRIQQAFASTGDGRAAVQQRTRLVEGILQRLWQQIISGRARSVGVRVGGTLADSAADGSSRIPTSISCSLHASSDAEPTYRDSIRRFSQELWDLRMKVSPTTRTLAECDRFDPANVEFTVSLLDCRYFAR